MQFPDLLPTNANAPLGVGVDIESIDRFADRAYADHPAFYQRLFSSEEIAYCQSRRHPAQHFAARFSAKEAAVKALHLYGRYYVRDFEVRKAADGAPILHIIRHRSECREPGSLTVSLSHCRTHAVAVVLAAGHAPLPAHQP
jgi:holo-[acyl-carrier protein] synthase